MANESFFFHLSSTGSGDSITVAPATNIGEKEMKRIALLLGIAVFATVVMQAQRKTTQQREEHAFEEAVTRAAEPEVKVFIHSFIDCRFAND